MTKNDQNFSSDLTRVWFIKYRLPSWNYFQRLARGDPQLKAVHEETSSAAPASIGQKVPIWPLNTNTRTRTQEKSGRAQKTPLVEVCKDTKKRNACIINLENEVSERLTIWIWHFLRRLVSGHYSDAADAQPPCNEKSKLENNAILS